MSHQIKKNLFPLVCAILFGVFFTPDQTSAQSVDQKCFTKSQCKEVRATFGAAGDGFVTGKLETIEACGQQTPTGEEMGFCLPPGKTKTTIAFGGRTEFENLGDFIQYGYRYGIIFAGLLAVLMIIAAGFQWTASGGNSSTIESAKKRITGAITGLILASTSYIILNTLNPNTVNLRLPQTWMINAISLNPSTCSEVKDGTKMKLASTKEEGKIDDKLKEQRLKNSSQFFPKAANSKITCGNSYFVAGSGKLTCSGDYCEPGKVCAAENLETESLGCQNGVLAGRIYHSGLFANVDNVGIRLMSEGWGWGGNNGTGWVVGPKISKDVIQLEAVCNDGDFENNLGNVHIDSIQKSEETKQQYYILRVDNIGTAIQKSKNDCSNNGGLRGFVLEIQFNEAGDPTYEDHYLGRTGSMGVDLGDDGAEDVTLASDASNAFVITEADLMKGSIINIDAAKVYDIDSDADRSVYAPYGYITDSAESKAAIASSTARRAARQAELNANPAAAANAEHEENRPVPD